MQDLSAACVEWVEYAVFTHGLFSDRCKYHIGDQCKGGYTWNSVERKGKRKRKSYDHMKCVVFLAPAKCDLYGNIEEKENRQLNYIYDYAMAHDLEPVKIVRIGEFLLVLRVRLLEKCVEAMQNEITTGILVSNMCNLTEKLSWIGRLIGLAQASGIRIVSVDNSELYIPIRDMEET